MGTRATRRGAFQTPPWLTGTEDSISGCIRNGLCVLWFFLNFTKHAFFSSGGCLTSRGGSLSVTKCNGEAKQRWNWRPWSLSDLLWRKYSWSWYSGKGWIEFMISEQATFHFIKTVDDVIHMAPLGKYDSLPSRYRNRGGLMVILWGIKCLCIYACPLRESPRFT